MNRNRKLIYFALTAEAQKSLQFEEKVLNFKSKTENFIIIFRVSLKVLFSFKFSLDKIVHSS